MQDDVSKNAHGIYTDAVQLAIINAQIYVLDDVIKKIKDIENAISVKRDKVSDTRQESNDTKIRTGKARKTVSSSIDKDVN